METCSCEVWRTRCVTVVGFQCFNWPQPVGSWCHCRGDVMSPASLWAIRCVIVTCWEAPITFNHCFSACSCRHSHTLSLYFFLPLFFGLGLLLTILDRKYSHIYTGLSFWMLDCGYAHFRFVVYSRSFYMRSFHSFICSFLHVLTFVDIPIFDSWSFSLLKRNDVGDDHGSVGKVGCPMIQGLAGVGSA